MPGPAVATIEAVGVDPAQLAHFPPQVGVRGLPHQVAVVAHEAIGVQRPVEGPDYLPEHIQEYLAVLTAQVDPVPAVAGNGYMEQGTRVFDPEGGMKAT